MPVSRSFPISGKKTLLVFTAVAAVFLALLNPSWAAGRRPVPPEDGWGFAVKEPAERRAAPEFSLPDLNAEERRLGDLRGSVVLLHFWASWCEPCKEEMPALEELHKTLGEKGFTVIAVAVDSRARVEAFKGDYGLDLPVLIDRYGGVMRLYGIRAIPSSVAVDREGYVRGVMVGVQDYKSPEALDFFERLLR